MAKTTCEYKEPDIADSELQVTLSPNVFALQSPPPPGGLCGAGGRCLQRAARRYPTASAAWGEAERGSAGEAAGDVGEWFWPEHAANRQPTASDA